MEVAADPYELKLYQMFQNCDAQRSGLLDEQSLRVLCENLELQDKGSSLIANLAAVDGGKTRVSFAKFKEALLNYLGNEFDGSSTTIGAPSAAAAATATTTTTPVTTNKSNTTNTNALTTTKTQQSGATATTQTTEKILVISDNAETVIDSPSELSDREVSPKLIVGSKKYGRRSRPGSIRNLEEFALTDSDRGADDESINNRLVQRSSSQTDIPGGGSTNGRRRRPLVPTGNKLKRCSSLPAQRNMHNLRTSKLITTNTTSGRNEDNNEDDDDNDSIEGLLKPPATGMGSSVESLEFCKGVEEIYSTTTTGRDHEVIPPYDGYEPPERWRRYQAKDSPPTHLESLPIQSIVEIWEQANIPHGRRILLALGFTDSSVNLLQLHKVLDEEIRGIDDDPDQFVRAALSLKSAELSMLRQTYRQLHDENAKLRSDNKEANRRLAYLAAEIDERHASLEETSQREIRLLEQRQANVVRDLTAKMQNDRENWTSLMARMEARVKQFEQNEIKLRTEVELVRRENSDFETEHKRLQKQLAEVLEKNIQLNREIAELEDVSGERDAAELRDRCAANTSAASAVSADEEMVASLMEKISKLQMENTGLRDKNDECVAELESLTLELKRLKVKAHKKSAAAGEAADEGASTADDSEHSGAGATATKRRGDSPSKAHVTEESPRLGKLRKCAADGEASEASDASGEWMALNSELRQVHAGSAELVAELRKKIADLEEKLAAAQGNGDKEASPSSKSPTPEERCKELELSLEQMQRAYEDCEDYWQSKLSEERQLFEKERQLYEDEHQESDKKFTELMEKVREYEEQFSKDGRLSPIEEKYSLEQQYVELEQEVEELREQSRTIIEEKSSEIEALQSEIEDLRLRLGESVEILTGACEMSTSGAAAGGDGPGGVHQSPASSPISYLWHQSTIQEPAKSLGEQIAIDINVSSAKNRINLSTSETAIFSTTPVSSGESGGGEGGSSANESPSTLSPIQKPQHSTTTTTTTPSTMGAATTPTRTTTTTKGAAVESEGGDIADCDTSSTTSGRSFETHSVSSGAQRKGTKGSEASCTSPSSVKEELKRLKFFEISLKEQIKDLSLQRDGLVMELQQLQEARPVLEKAYARTAHPTLIQRVNQLELRNRHLQNVIKQQQQYTESLMQQSWQQHQIELSDLHGRIENQGILISEQVQRLQNADILVKDLYVENSHLTATIQRFEQQRVRANMMQQQQQQHHQQQQHIMQQQQLHALNGLAGMP